MAITRQQKEDQVRQLSQEFGRSKLTVLVDYQGLSVAEAQELRHLLQAQGSSIKVAKNNLIKLAANQHEAFAELDKAIFSGPMALAFGFEDEVAPAQVVANYAKQHRALEIVGAISADGSFMTAEAVKQLASLPSKQQLQGQLVGTIAAPLTGFVNVLAGNLRGLVQVLNQYSQKQSNNA